MISILQDTRAIFQVIGSLLQNPDLLVSGEYTLDLEDFPQRFHKIIFSAIYNLYNNETQSISIVEIDNYISKFKEQYDIFVQNKGIEYLEAAKKLAEKDNFNANCLTIRKFSLLRDLDSQNFNVLELYDENDEDKIKKFHKMDIDEILNHFNKKIIGLEEKYGDIQEGIQAGDKIDELIESYKETPEMGLDCGINALNYFTFGLRKKYHIFSAKTGDGKTRLQVYFAKHLAVKQKVPTLFITTELEYDEIQAMLLSGVSGVPERHIILNQYKLGEEEKVKKAAKEIKDSGLYVVYVPDFTVEKIEYIIKKYILLFGVRYVFFDYIKASMSIISNINRKTGGGLQVYQILTLLSEKLDSLKKIYKIGIISSTQLTEEDKIKGAKDIKDTTDVFGKLRLASKEEIEKYELDFYTVGFDNRNYVHMFIELDKNRRGEKNVLIGLAFNHGTLDIVETVVIKNGEIMEIPKVKFEQGVS